jgi:hypothetical protein
MAKILSNRSSLTGLNRVSSIRTCALIRYRNAGLSPIQDVDLHHPTTDEKELFL